MRVDVEGKLGELCLQLQLSSIKTKWRNGTIYHTAVLLPVVIHILLVSDRLCFRVEFECIPDKLLVAIILITSHGGRACVPFSLCNSTSCGVERLRGAREVRERCGRGVKVWEVEREGAGGSITIRTGRPPGTSPNGRVHVMPQRCRRER
ncbi:hypothetical protein JOL62DRAFT_581518 [Phyllosticta paracitricarpa]|uniref:Uncharacterized protein n=1 Tax=Phyllosticta paracitricarpa TaxID=2016321 RepID=A0ABR1MZN0_9PEZI